MIHTWRGLTDVKITSVFKLQEDLELTDSFRSVFDLHYRHLREARDELSCSYAP